jgi:hypothetical protein
MSVAAFHEEFARVSRSFPCPVCGKQTWCIVHESGDYVVCQRVESDKPYGKGGRAGWRHDLDDPVDAPPPSAAPINTLEDIRQAWCDSRDAATPERLAPLAVQLGVKIGSLRSLGVGWNAERSVYTLPMFDGCLNLTGLQFRAPDGFKYAMAGSRPGLFLPDCSLLFSPHWRTPDQLYVTEGASDCAAVLTLGGMAVGRQNAQHGLDELRQLRVAIDAPSLRWVFVADNDDAGAEGARAVAAEFPGAVVIRPSRLKDARAVMMDGGTLIHMSWAAAGHPNKYWTPLDD